MRILLDTSLLVEGERRNFDLGKWVVADLENLTITTVDVDHFKALGVRAVNPLK